MAVVEDPTVINGQNTLISNPPPFVKCNYCKKDFTKDCSRRRHELNIHGVSTIKDNEVAEKPVPDASTVCRFCDKVFANSSNKRAHERRQHGINPSPTAYPDGLTVVICKECNVTFSTLNNYRKHLLESHQIESQKAQHVFTSEEEFLGWKGSLEMDIGVNYTAHSGPRNTCDGIKQIFYCRRSGVKSTKIHGKRQRAEKRQGTCKLGSYCTSSMEVVKMDGKIRVTLYHDHRDHDLGGDSLVHMTLPKTEQDIIAQVEKYQEEMKSKIKSQLLPKCSEIKDLHVLKTANSMLSKLIATLDAGRIYPANTNKGPVDISTISEPDNKSVSNKTDCIPQKRENEKTKEQT